MTNEKLKPCPFCGSYHVHVCTIPTGYKLKPRVWYVKCDKCETRSGMLFTKLETIAAWNARAERTCKPTESGRCLHGTDCPAWLCSECGELFELGTNFCSNCGAKVIEEKGKGNDGE